MSLLSRLSSRFRQDASTIIPPAWGSAVDKNAPPTFIPQLISRKVDDVEDLSHLGEVSRKDPVGYYITYGIADESQGDGFVLVDENGEEVRRDRAIQHEMRILKARERVTLAEAYAAAYGYAYLYTGKNRYVPKTPQGGKLASLHAFTPEQCVVKRYSEKGVAIQMELTVNVGEGEYTTREKKITLPAEDFIFVVPRPLPNNPYQGKSALEPVWDDLTYLRYIMHSMTWYDMKIARGMLVVISKDGIPDTWATALNTSLEEHSAKTAMAFDGSKVDDVKYVSATSSATDFDAHMDAALCRVAAGTGVPKDVLVGITGGTNAAANTAEKSSHKKISEVQGDSEVVWRQLIGRMGYPTDGYGFNWNARFAHDEEERSKIDEAIARTWSIKMGFMTIDEVRAELGMPPLPDRRGDMLSSEASDFNIGVQGLQGTEKQEQTRNPQGDQIPS